VRLKYARSNAFFSPIMSVNFHLVQNNNNVVLHKSSYVCTVDTRMSVIGVVLIIYRFIFLFDKCYISLRYFPHIHTHTHTNTHTHIPHIESHWFRRNQSIPVTNMIRPFFTIILYRYRLIVFSPLHTYIDSKSNRFSYTRPLRILI